jgi:hypothetical protein
LPPSGVVELAGAAGCVPLAGCDCEFCGEGRLGDADVPGGGALLWPGEAGADWLGEADVLG